MVRFDIFRLIPFLLAMGLISCPQHHSDSLPICLSAPAHADYYGVGGTDLQTGAAVDAIRRPVRQALAV